MNNYENDQDSRNIVNQIQTNYDCCGSNTWLDWSGLLLNATGNTTSVTTTPTTTNATFNVTNTTTGTVVFTNTTAGNAVITNTTTGTAGVTTTTTGTAVVTTTTTGTAGVTTTTTGTAVVTTTTTGTTVVTTTTTGAAVVTTTTTGAAVVTTTTTGIAVVTTTTTAIPAVATISTGTIAVTATTIASTIGRVVRNIKTFIDTTESISGKKNVDLTLFNMIIADKNLLSLDVMTNDLKFKRSPFQQAVRRRRQTQSDYGGIYGLPLSFGVTLPQSCCLNGLSTTVNLATLANSC